MWTHFNYQDICSTISRSNNTKICTTTALPFGVLIFPQFSQGGGLKSSKNELSPRQSQTSGALYALTWSKLCLLTLTRPDLKLTFQQNILMHDEVIRWKLFARYWSFVRVRGMVNSLHKGQWRRALMFSLTCARINDWINNHKAGDLIRHRAHYDVTVLNLHVHVWYHDRSVMSIIQLFWALCRDKHRKFIPYKYVIILFILL